MKIEIFGWYLHEVKQKERFGASELAACFDATHTSRPANIHSVIGQMCQRKPPRMLRDARGYRLSASARADLSKSLPQRSTSVTTTALLNTLVEKVTDPAQRTFLTETLICFKHHAYRASVVMAWNLAFSDVLDRILSAHLTTFNAQLSKVAPKASVITKRTDFEDLKESKVIEVARGAGILSATSARILTEKLNKRNTAAHPSTVTISPVTAEEVIFDLVENIILRVAL